MAEFNHLAPSIDRLFRFVEMIGVTALLGTILETEGPVVTKGIIFAGTVLAINYLIEPPVELVAGQVIGTRVVGEKLSSWRVLGATGIFALSFALTVIAAPYVGKLAVLIGNTIR